MFQSGLTVANLNAIAMEPMGHIAGMAASVIGSVSTILGACFASMISLALESTTLNLANTVLALCVIAGVLMHLMRQIEETD